MSKRLELEDRLHALNDISGILGAMKNLALLEIQKVGRFQSAQGRVVAGMEQAAADFFLFYPNAYPAPDQTRPVWLVIGSERGFCGDFNQVLIQAFLARREKAGGGPHLVMAVGQKLSSRLEKDHPLAATLAGPTVAEEVQPVLIRLMDRLRELQRQQKWDRPFDLRILHHRPDTGRSQVHLRRPLQPLLESAHRFAYPPLLNLDPLALSADLLDHYLFAILHEVFSSSLMAENLSRFQHMDQAVQRLEKDISALALRRNVLRQEEITEEIEVIMLSVEALRKS
jgi:F-type H+-transporting ATPase subunit gamma